MELLIIREYLNIEEASELKEALETRYNIRQLESAENFTISMVETHKRTDNVFTGWYSLATKDSANYPTYLAYVAGWFDREDYEIER